MQTLELLKKATEYLESKNIESPRNEAEILLCKALDCKRIDLYADFEKIITESEKEIMRHFLRRRISGEPLQYITSAVQFRFIELDVEEGVFIPRPETEVLVQLALDYLKRDTPLTNQQVNNKIDGDCLRVLEIGTGTGAIAISLAKEAHCAVTATDVNKKALNLASFNAKKANVKDKIKFIESKYYENLSEKYHMIVSNPPYIAEKFCGSLPKDVKREPPEALFSGEEGLNAVKEILKKASHYLVKGGIVILEISPEQGEAVLEYAKQSGFSDVSLEKDLSGRIRFVKVLWKPS